MRNLGEHVSRLSSPLRSEDSLSVWSYILSPSAPSPSSCVAAAVAAPGQRGAVSRECRDPTEPVHETWWCGNAGNDDAHGCGSPSGPGS